MNISNYSVQPISKFSSSGSEQRPTSEPLPNNSAALHADRVDISTAGYEALKDSQSGESIDPRNASYHDIEKLANQLYEDGKISGMERGFMKASAHMEMMSKHDGDLDKKIDFVGAWKGWASFEHPSVQDGPHPNIYQALLNH